MWRPQNFNVVCVDIWCTRKLQGCSTPVGAFPDDHKWATSEGKLGDLGALLPALGSVAPEVPLWRLCVLVVTIIPFGIGGLQFGCHGRLLVGHLLHEDHDLLLLLLSHLLYQPQVGNVHLAHVARR